MMAVYFNGTQVSTMYFGGTVGWGGTGTLQSQTFLTSGTFTVPANVRQLYVQCTGGGAGACLYAWGEGSPVGYGGGGSGMVSAFLHVVPGTAYTVTIGAPSAAGQNANGGTTSFDALVSCTGGLTPIGRLGPSLNVHSSTGINGYGIYVNPGINRIVAPTVFTGGGMAGLNQAVGGPGGFGSGTPNAVGTSYSGAGGSYNTTTGQLYAGGSGRCVVYWFTYS